MSDYFALKIAEQLNHSDLTWRKRPRANVRRNQGMRGGKRENVAEKGERRLIANFCLRGLEISRITSNERLTSRQDLAARTKDF